MTFVAGLIPILIFAILIQKYYREFHPEIRQTIKRAYDEQWSHSEVLLRESVGTLVEQKARDVSLQITLILGSHPYMTLKDLQNDKEFRKIAVQSFGRTGYTSLHETHTGIIRFHKEKRLENMRTGILKRNFPALWAIIRESRKGGKPASGYYGWRKSGEETRQKYIYVVPVRQPTGDGVHLSVGVSGSMEEFSDPIRDAEAVHRKTVEHLGAASDRIFQSFKWFGIVSMGFGIVIVSLIAFGVGLYFSRAITRLRVATQKVVEGDFSVSVKPSMSGEVRTLAQDFNRMVRQLADTTVSKELLEKSERRLVKSNHDLQHEIIVRTAAEKTLSTEKERLAVTLRSIRDGVITTDRQGSVVLINRAAEALTGWSQAEAGGRGLAEIFRSIDEGTKMPAANPVDATIAGDAEGLERTQILVGRDGSESVIALSGAPIKDNDGAILGVVIVFRDITWQRKMEEQMQRLRKFESVSTLARGVAHDFNNLLSVILGNISLAKMLIDPENKIHRRLTDAEDATMKGRDLIYRLLAYSREGGYKRTAVSLKPVIQEWTDRAMNGSGKKCAILIAEDLYQAEVNKEQIGEVIQTIVMNAREATPEDGVITVRAENIKLEAYDTVPLPDGNYVKISIEDQGDGISDEDLPRIFDPYFTTKEMGNTKGTGLGLAISHSIVTSHNGLFTVDSSKGAGTVFHIYLPACV
jgi:PAS domain S-box-containing protein